MKIVLIRHGESAGNINPETYHDYHDNAVPLTENGIEQAKALGILLKDHFQKSDLYNSLFYHSPYQRAVETKNIATHAIRSNTHSTESFLLREIEFGQFNSTHMREWDERHFEAVAHIERNKDLGAHVYTRYPMGESIADVALRAETFLNKINTTPIEDCNNATLFIFAHNVILKTLHIILTETSINRYQDIPGFENAEARVFHIHAPQTKAHKIDRLLINKTQDSHAQKRSSANKRGLIHL